MKIKTTAAAVVIGSALMVVAGASQAACSYKNSGWHMVSRTCDIHPANTWQVYNSGNYIQPVTDSSTVFWPNKIIQ